MRAQVEATIELIRPALHADGGDVLLQDVDEATGIVTVTLIGACGTCPSSTVTLKAGIERIMKDRVPGVVEVVNDPGLAPDGSFVGADGVPGQHCASHDHDHDHDHDRGVTTASDQHGGR
jgi:Fe-S cluster biogenesis protein NfuA